MIGYIISLAHELFDLLFLWLCWQVRFVSPLTLGYTFIKCASQSRLR